jgi:hypothetical protein
MISTAILRAQCLADDVIVLGELARMPGATAGLVRLQRKLFSDWARSEMQVLEHVERVYSLDSTEAKAFLAEGIERAGFVLESLVTP